MADSRPKPSIAVQLVLLSLIAAALVAPIIVYVATFGPNLSNEHARWGEMGSAMSGIYTPILSLLALFVLVAQVRLQNQINAHQFDQAYIQEARSDVEYYLEQLDHELSKVLDNGTTVREFLHTGFEFANLEELGSNRLLEIAREFNRRFPRALSIWSAIYPVFIGLNSQKHFPYAHNFQSAKQKAIVMISFETCVALDQYVWCVSEGHLNFPYEFSPALSSKSQ